MISANLAAADIIRLLDLRPHPEGGHFRETFRDARPPYPPPLAGKGRQGVSGRAASTAIYFLLARNERSRWYRIDAAEVCHWYAGAPLRLDILPENGNRQSLTLGSDLAAGQRPQAVVPVHAWQEGLVARRLDADRLHRGARLRVFEVRAGARWLGAAQLGEILPAIRRQCRAGDQAGVI